MNCAENYWSQQSSSIYIPSHHIIQDPKVLSAREIKVQHQIIVLSIKFRKCFVKFMIQIALLRSF